MSGLKAIRKRISTVKNTQKITRAMKMVAAARLRKAQQRIVELRPYALKTEEMLHSVAAKAGEESHPLLAQKEEKKAMVIVISGDRGLAGAFNTNINKSAFRLVQQLQNEGKEVCVATIGRKGRDYFARRGVRIIHEFTGIFEDLGPADARRISRYVIHAFAPGFRVGMKDEDLADRPPELDSIYLAYNEFKSAISQKAKVERLLPLVADDKEPKQLDYIYEPSKRVLLDQLISMYIETQLYRALSESVAAEHGARMTAMDNATRNASDMIGKLTLRFNRARQAAITTELMEIIGGAEALK